MVPLVTLTTINSALALQVYEAVLSAATPSTVELSTPNTVANTSTPHGRLLNSNLQQTPPTHTGSSGSTSNTLDATLYALNMEYSSGALRNEVGKALIGVHFAHLAPTNLTDHLRIELHDGKELGTEAKNMVHVPGNAQGQIVSVSLPDGYTGLVRFNWKACSVSVFS